MRRARDVFEQACSGIRYRTDRTGCNRKVLKHTAVVHAHRPHETKDGAQRQSNHSLPRSLARQNALPFSSRARNLEKGQNRKRTSTFLSGKAPFSPQSNPAQRGGLIRQSPRVLIQFAGIAICATMSASLSELISLDVELLSSDPNDAQKDARYTSELHSAGPWSRFLAPVV